MVVVGQSGNGRGTDGVAIHDDLESHQTEPCHANEDDVGEMKTLRSDTVKISQVKGREEEHNETRRPKSVTKSHVVITRISILSDETPSELTSASGLMSWLGLMSGLGIRIGLGRLGFSFYVAHRPVEGESTLK